MAEQNCQNKIPFKTQADAEAAIALARHRYGPGEYTTYKCNTCQDWHIARSTSKEDA